MNSKQRFTNNIQKYDVGYINPGFNKVIEALIALNNGERVLLIFEEELVRDDYFQLSQTFPFHFFEIPKVIKSRHLLKKLFLIIPQLVQPQKVIYFPSKKAKVFAKIIDLFFQKTFNSKSAILNKKRPENLSFIKNPYLEGIIFQEYKINISRIFIELLKHFELKGGKINVKEPFQPEEVTSLIQCKTINKQSLIISSNTPSNFIWVNKIESTIFRFIEFKNKLQVEVINSKNRILPKNQILNKISKAIEFNFNEVVEYDSTLYISTKTITTILNTISNPLPGSFKNTTIHDNYDLSLEKFDIAKQTGITYPEFKILFHRYGNGIDEMIDEAYEKMNKERNAKKIWTEVEDWVQRKNEWKK